MTFYQPGLTYSDHDRQLILEALKYHKYNKTDTASALKIGRKRLYWKLKRYGLYEQFRVRGHRDETFLPRGKACP